MTTIPKPAARPANPIFFRSLRQASRMVDEALDISALGRSHRAKIGKAKL